MTLRPGRVLLAAYLIALGASTVWRLTHRRSSAPGPGEAAVSVSITDGRPVTIAYREMSSSSPEGSGKDTSRLPVVLIHGSPGDNGEVAGIGQVVGTLRRAVAPDLPGFGHSTRTVPNYSVAAHARYLNAMLDSLGIPRAHLVGFSMGGGVVLELADLAPDRVASLSLLSALGAQEYELLGDYHLNHAIHGLQLAAVWSVENLLPHFGRLDGGMLSIEYCRNFFDTDQRPLRRILGSYSGPALVIQGDKDFLVDPAVARESSRLLPQSELVMLTDPQANHFMAFQRPDTLGRVLGNFFDRVEAGQAAIRASADPVRLAAAAQPFDPASIPPVLGVALLVMLLMIAAATLISEDLACIATGLMVSRGTIAFIPGVTACFVGIVIGDLWLYGMGRWLGRPALLRAPLRWFVSEAAVQRSAAWFARRGMLLVLVARFVPGTRLPTYFTAGVLRAGALRFLGLFLVAAALWTPLLVGASALFGSEVLARFVAYQTIALPGLLALALAMLVMFNLLLPLGSWRGRRLLLSRWRRLTRWEFWPRWAFYPPIAAYIGWLALRHRSVTLFTAVNPAIPGGGFVGESKAQILRGLAHAPDRVAAWRLLDEDTTAARVESLGALMTAHGLHYPIVLKPDIGERGDGVAVVSSESAALGYLERTHEPILAQEYVGGIEVGIFYYRMPDDDQGRVFAITDKQFPSVAGDGRSTLEHLILADDRAVSMAPFFLASHLARLEEIPPAGEVVPLVQVGTHSRGSVFHDGEWMRTPALEAAIDRLSRPYRGFWFGRYDIRAPSAEAIREGRDFKVLELNGATAEATSIYDPKHRIGQAYAVLRRQWAILFEIARQNVAAGARPATWPDLIELVRRHRRATQAHHNI